MNNKFKKCKCKDGISKRHSAGTLMDGTDLIVCLDCDETVFESKKYKSSNKTIKPKLLLMEWFFKTYDSKRSNWCVSCLITKNEKEHAEVIFKGKSLCIECFKYIKETKGIYNND